jgi:hypothetical protein
VDVTFGLARDQPWPISVRHGFTRACKLQRTFCIDNQIRRAGSAFLEQRQAFIHDYSSSIPSSTTFKCHLVNHVPAIMHLDLYLVHVSDTAETAVSHGITASGCQRTHPPSLVKWVLSAAARPWRRQAEPITVLSQRRIPPSKSNLHPTFCCLIPIDRAPLNLTTVHRFNSSRICPSAP